MYDAQMSEQDRNVLRWGGFAGIAGSLLLVATFGIVATLISAEDAGAAGERAIVLFPEIRSARVAENGLYLAALVLWAAHLLALYRALRDTSRAPAIFGSALGILGLTIMAAGALLHVGFDPIADLYHAAGTTPQDRTTLVMMWHATQGMFDTLFVTGLVMVPAALTALGLAMFKAPAFGRRLGRMSVGFGLFGAVAAVVLLIEPGHPIAVGDVLRMIVFNLIVGWKAYALSRSPRTAIVADRLTATSA